MSIDPKSISVLLARLKCNDQLAAGELWERVIAELRIEARRRLRHAPRRVADEEDLAQVAFMAFLEAVEAGRLPKLNDREDLWKILFTVLNRRAINQMRQPMRGDSALANQAEPIAKEPSPQEAVMVLDEVRHLLSILDDEEQRQIALLKLEGLTDAEIATRISRSRATVERRLRAIRQIWQDFDPG